MAHQHAPQMCTKPKPKPFVLSISSRQLMQGQIVLEIWKETDMRGQEGPSAL